MIVRNEALIHGWHFEVMFDDARKRGPGTTDTARIQSPGGEVLHLQFADEDSALYEAPAELFWRGLFQSVGVETE